MGWAGRRPGAAGGLQTLIRTVEASLRDLDQDGGAVSEMIKGVGRKLIGARK